MTREEIESRVSELTVIGAGWSVKDLNLANPIKSAIRLTLSGDFFEVARPTAKGFVLYLKQSGYEQLPSDIKSALDTEKPDTATGYGAIMVEGHLFASEAEAEGSYKTPLVDVLWPQKTLC